MEDKRCCIEGCDRGMKWGAQGYCCAHYQYIRKGKEPPTTLRGPKGKGSITAHGYLRKQVKGKQRYVHQLVMEEHLGRRLRQDENVHHINGDRLDNRIENLELWSTSQPCGQRIPDKVKHALELLKRYAPEELDGRNYLQETK